LLSVSTLKTIRLPFSANIKLALVLLALVIVGGTLLYTQRLVEELKRSERKTITLYTSVLQSSLSIDEPSTEATGIAYNIFQSIDFPVILTNHERKLNPVPASNGKVSFADFVKNVKYDTTASLDMQERQLSDRMEEMASTYDPLPIYFVQGKDSSIVNYVFYDDSNTIKRLRWLPYVEITIGAMFILVGYLSFSHIKRNEQSNIWVGMAKETAHQLGTPLSSLLGWIELLRLMPEDTEQVMEAANEMQRDVERLNKVAQRFSKIGSAAEVRTVEINAVIENVVTYFKRRLPHLGKRVTLSLDAEGPVYVAINVDLFEWVFENLVRNAADAIDKPEGEIRFRVREFRRQAYIDISDNGRGIDPKIRKDIFRPGFSTKTRGWGLGLSLAKRIVEEYHGGKIAVKESSPEGTTFRIRLDAVEPEEKRNGVVGNGRRGETAKQRDGEAARRRGREWKIEDR
jgi:two-component sensor histidine kinase